MDTGGFCAQQLYVFLGVFRAGFIVKKAKVAQLAQMGHIGVVLYVQPKCKAVAFAVFGGIADALIDCSNH